MDTTLIPSMTRPSAMQDRVDIYTNAGLDPYSKDDTCFGATMVYCCSHLRAHSTGWCTVSVYNKIPLDTPFDAGQDTADNECRDKGYDLYVDHR